MGAMGFTICDVGSLDDFIVHTRGWPSASKIEAKIFTEFELNLDHPGGNEEGKQDENHQEPESRPSGGEMLNLDHPGWIHFLISLISPPDGLDSDS